ncbi:MAG: segregation/condensation protein A [Ileibacterium sp.]|nr:segregation/condensation protein A [Ileibacterium sp.]
MEFKVSLNQFEGPLDLMLHLISKNKLDLFDLDLQILAEQYCSYIQTYIDKLDAASEYMVEFASLLEYKSRKLLPKKEAELDAGYEEDQRDKLVARLVEYQRYKEAAASLKEFEEDRQKHVSRMVSSLVEEWSVPKEEGSLEGLNIYELSKAMKRVLRRHAVIKPYETTIQVKELSAEERIAQLAELLPSLAMPVRFETLCADCRRLHEIIVTFLAVLEMIHMNKLTYTIDDKETIWLQTITN